MQITESDRIWPNLTEYWLETSPYKKNKWVLLTNSEPFPCIISYVGVNRKGVKFISNKHTSKFISKHSVLFISTDCHHYWQSALLLIGAAQEPFDVCHPRRNRAAERTNHSTDKQKCTARVWEHVSEIKSFTRNTSVVACKSSDVGIVIRWMIVVVFVTLDCYGIMCSLFIFVFS